MKNKNLHLVAFEFSLFREKFISFAKDGEGASAQVSETPELQAKKKLFFEKLNEGLNPEVKEFDPNVNPYGTEMKAFLESLPNLSAVTFKTPEKNNGKLILKYDEAGTEKTLTIEGHVYISIFWGEISAKLELAMFSGKNVSNELLLLGITEKTAAPKFHELVDKLAKAVKVTEVSNEDPLVAESLKELEALRSKLNLGGAQARGEMKAQLDAQGQREAAKLDVERNRIQLPEGSSIANSKFIEMAEDAPNDFRTGFKPLETNVKLEKFNIDPSRWKTTTDQLLNIIYVEWKELGIPVTSPFYQKMFSILRDANNPQKNKLLSNPDYVKWFRDPESNLVNIGNIGTDVGEEANDFPQAFVKAYAHFAYVRSEMLSKTVKHQSTLEAQRGLDRHAIADKPVEFLKTNYAKFSQAIKERDYATAGVYVLGIYAMYKSWKALSNAKNEDGTDKYPNLRNWLFYGVAGYAGYVFAKNAGYDILKMAGLKDEDSEVRGTPMEAIAAMNLPEAEGLDYDVVLRISETKVSDLNDLFEKSTNNFIHPVPQFSQIFPNLANVGSFPMGIGEEGLADSTGNTKKTLTTKQREYIRVGRQLYKAMLVLRAAYDKTLAKEEGRSFADAMKDPTFREAKIRHLCAVFGLYSFHSSEATLLSSRAEQKLKDQLSAAFKTYGDDTVSAVADVASKKPGIYKGTVKGFPVYFVYNVTEKKFFVYLANEYGGDEIPGRKTIAEIPLTGESKQKEEVGKAVKAIDDRMAKLLTMIKAGSEKPTFDGSRWTAKVKMPGNPEFGKQPYESLATITPMPNGDGLTVLMEGSDIPFDLNAHNAERTPLTIGLLHEMFNNPEFDAFRPFYNVGMLSITDPTTGDQKFTLKISKLGKEIDIKYNAGATPKFTVADRAQEKAMLEDISFSKNYVEALAENKNFELNQTLANLEGLITNVCPKGFWSNLGDIITGNTQTGSLSRFDVTSRGVPENYTKMIIATAKYTVLGRLQKSVESQKSFKDVEKVRISVLADANSKLSRIHESILKRSLELKSAGKSWDQTEFMTTVVSQLRLASTLSGTYGFEQSRMEQDIYTLDLPGFSGFDSSKGAHLSAGKLMKVFAYHTAYLDNQEYEFASGKATVSLDGLTSGPTPTPGISKPKEDPALRGHLIVRYFEYVRNKVFEKAGQLSSLSEISIPAPGDRHWDILDFDRWADTIGDYRSLDPLANLPPMEHDIKKHEARKADGEYDFDNMDTELDIYMQLEFSKAVNYLLMELGPGVLNMSAINDYLKGTEQEGDEPGFFEIEIDENDKAVSRSWDATRRVAENSQGKRPLQVQIVQEEVNKFIRMIYEEKLPNGKARFIMEQPGIFDRIKHAMKKKWPTLFS